MIGLQIRSDKVMVIYASEEQRQDSESSLPDIIFMFIITTL